MRLIIALIVAALTAVGGWFAYPTIYDTFQLGRLPSNHVKPKPEPPKPAPVIEVEEMPEIDENPPEPIMPPEPEPEVVEVMPPPPPPVDPDAFRPPTFQPIEILLDNWKNVPRNAFPREVQTNKNIAFKSSSVEIKKDAGTSITAIALINDMLTVAPTPTSNLRSHIHIDDTNLKEILINIYGRWKQKRIAQARAAWKYNLENKGRMAEFGSMSDTDKNAKAGDKPKKNPDGSYPVLLDSMRKGEVTEITLESIISWGDAQYEEIDGRSMWTVIVKYTANTIFGRFETEAQARLNGNRVEKWVYVGSGEVVP